MSKIIPFERTKKEKSAQAYAFYKKEFQRICRFVDTNAELLEDEADEYGDFYRFILHWILKTP